MKYSIYNVKSVIVPKINAKLIVKSIKSKLLATI
jgi:hypothetical protein